MVTLTAWAQTVRADAERARGHSESLRRRIDRQVELSARRRVHCEKTIAVAELQRSAPVASAWSNLPWQTSMHFDDVLELVEP